MPGCLVCGRSRSPVGSSWRSAGDGSVQLKPRLLELLGQLPITVEEIEGDATLTTVRALARSTGLTAYDASCLALAAASGVPLAPADRRLQLAAIEVGVDLIGLPEGG
jgi:predicted nucleic acid-binding protein